MTIKTKAEVAPVPHWKTKQTENPRQFFMRQLAEYASGIVDATDTIELVQGTENGGLGDAFVNDSTCSHLPVWAVSFTPANSNIGNSGSAGTFIFTKIIYFGVPGGSNDGFVVTLQHRRDEGDGFGELWDVNWSTTSFGTHITDNGDGTYTVGAAIFNNLSLNAGTDVDHYWAIFCTA